MGRRGGERRRTGCGSEDYEAGPVVLYQFAHCQEEVGSGGSTVIGGKVEVRALSVVVGRREWAAVEL